MHNEKKFGDFVRELRVRNRIGLREFCTMIETDPSNWSKLERGLLPPPLGNEELEQLARVLGVQKDSDDWWQLMDLAAAERGRVPSDIMSDGKLVGMLPMFFRTIRGEKPNADEMQRLAEKIRRS